MIRGINDASLADGLIETGPAAAALELSVAPEQGVAAYGTIVGAYLFGMLEGAAPGPFGAFQPGYGKDILRKDLCPLLIVEADFCGITMGIDRVGFVFCSVHDVLFQLIGSLRISTMLEGQRHQYNACNPGQSVHNIHLLQQM